MPSSSTVKIAGVELEKRRSVRDLRVPRSRCRLVLTETTKGACRLIAQAILLGEAVMLEGETGVGKSALIRFLAYLTKTPVYWVNLSEQTDPSELIGKYAPTAEQDRFEWIDGVLIRAMKEGAWLFLDDINLAPASILERMNSLLDEDRFIAVTEHAGERVRPAGGFRLFAARNPLHYQGRQRLSAAFVNKFTQVYVSDQADDEKVRILSHGEDGLSQATAKALVAFAGELVKGLEDEKLDRSRLGGYRFGLRDLLRWKAYIQTYTVDDEQALTTAFGRGAMYVYYDRLETREARKLCFDTLSRCTVGKEQLDLAEILEGRNLAADIRPTTCELLRELMKGVDGWRQQFVGRCLASTNTKVWMAGCDAVSRLDGVPLKLRRLCAKALVKALRDDDPRIRAHSASALGRLGMADDDITEVLLSQLDTEQEREARHACLLAITRIGLMSERAVRTLRQIAANDEDPYFWKDALRALSASPLEEAVDLGRLLAQLKHARETGEEKTGVALVDLVDLGADRPDVAHAVADCLGSERPFEIRKKAADQLRIAAAERRLLADKQVRDSLITALRHDEEILIRVQVTQTIIALGAVDQRLINELLAQLEDDTDAAARERAAMALESIGDGYAEAIPVLLWRAERDPEERVRLRAGMAVISLCDGDRSVIEKMVRRLRIEKTMYVKDALGWALVKAGVKHTAVVVHAIGVVRRSTSAHEIGRWAEAVGCIGGGHPTALAALMDALRRGAARARLVNGGIRRGLASLSAEDGEVAERLLCMLRTGDPARQQGAAEVLAEVATAEDADVIKELVQQLRQSDSTGVRGMAARSLGKIGPTARAAIAALASAVEEDKEPEVRKAAVEAIRAIGSTDEQVIRCLLRQLRAERSNRVRPSILSALIMLWTGPLDATSADGLMDAVRRVLTDEAQTAIAVGLVDDLLNRWPELYGRFEQVFGLVEGSAQLGVQVARLLITAIERSGELFGGEAIVARNADRIGFYLDGDCRSADPRILEPLVAGRQGIGGPRVPNMDEAQLVLTPGMVSHLCSLLSAVRMNHAAALVGETGVGKTALVRFLASLTNHNYVRINLKDMAEVSELVGGYVPTEDGSLVWKDGLLVQAMKEGDWVVLDEANLAGPGVLERLNQLLDPDGQMELQECGSKDGEPIHPHPDFRLFVTMNPTDYAGRNAMSPAFVNRFVVKWFDKPSSAELTQIVAGKYGVDEDAARRLVTFHQAIAASAEHRELGRQRAERYVYTLRDLQAVMKRLRNGDGGDHPDLAAADVVRCVQDVYGARLSHKEDRDLFETHIKACFSMACATRGAK